MSRAVRVLVSAFLVLPAIASAQRAAPQPAVAESLFRQLKFRHIGPEGNRVSAVAGVIGDPNVYYAGAASGGIFKTSDGGIHWEPIFDSMPVSSIGALAVAPRIRTWSGPGPASRHPQQHLARLGGLQIDRCGQDLDPEGPRQHRTNRPHRRRPEQSRHGVRCGAWDAPTDRSRSAGSTAPPTAGRPGSGCCSSNDSTGAMTSSWIPPTPGFSSRPPGSS